MFVSLCNIKIIYKVSFFLFGQYHWCRFESRVAIKCRSILLIFKFALVFKFEKTYVFLVANMTTFSCVVMMFKHLS